MKFFIAAAVLFILSLTTQTASAQQTDLKNLSEIELKQAFAEDDSSKALINLFYRKRKGALLRGLIGGGLAGYSAGSALGAGNTAGALIGPIVFSPLWITSITAGNKYKQENLLQILESHRQGEFIPQKYAKKLRTKDFGN